MGKVLTMIEAEMSFDTTIRDAIQSGDYNAWKDRIEQAVRDLLLASASRIYASIVDAALAYEEVHGSQ
jgi:hypothetical protein